MVLFKRKPVAYLTQPSINDDGIDVWVIQQTGEIFTSYESYLSRLDFYKQRRFICEITGHSALTFFEALSSETEGSHHVDRSFPDALREPVLRKVQFSTISRIDNLVDHIYDEFKQDFYPGEHVTALLGDGARLGGTIREKAKFPELTDADGNIERKAFSRYFVSLDNQPDSEALVDDEHIMRDRKSLTKQMLRSFIKNTVTRESWTGAPWLVKENIAHKMKIDTEVPAHLQYENKIAEKKAQLAQQKKMEHDANLLSMFHAQQRLAELKPASKSHKSKQQQQQLARSKQQQFFEYQHALGQDPEFVALATTGRMNGQTQFIHANFPSLAPIVSKGPPKPPAPPPIKYPIEDLDVSPKRDGTHRPRLKYLRKPASEPSKGLVEDTMSLRTESVGPLLETWETLNVYCEVFQLDSFTFDDYVEALQSTSDHVECELFVEMHCAVLKILVDAEAKGGKVNVSLPDLPDEASSEEEESIHADSIVPTPTPEPEVKPRGRATRSSMNKLEAAAQKDSPKRNSTPPETKTHRAVEMLAEYGWVDRLRKRDFRHGGWEIIIVGLLYQLALSPRRQELCESLLRQLAPIDQSPTQETARSQYANLDVNSRVKVLQIICLLSVETKAIRGYMEECSEQMTVFRKEKIEWQRARKVALEELRMLNDERKILLPDNTPASPEPVMEVDGDVKMSGTGADGEDEEAEAGSDEAADETEDETPRNGRSLRRGVDRAAERKRKREEEREKKEKAEKAPKEPKLSNHFKKVLRDIEKKKDRIRECEDEIATLDNDLREADCPRSRCLGKDRFWNRYWWFERNGMPYAGLPSTYTEEAGYANGCLWIQGPDVIEREGFLELKGDDARSYEKAHQMSVSERQKLEEGPTSVPTARDWGFFDEPDDLDMLIGWLDSRGHRELKLRKELQAQREKIALHMQKRQEYLSGQHRTDEPVTRTSGRTKTRIDIGNLRSATWRNTTALKELGHLHSEQTRSRKAAKKADLDRETRSRTGKKAGGRQGSRYRS